MRSRARTMMRAVLVAVALGLWYLVAAASVSWEEVVAAAVSGVVAALAAFAAAGQDRILPAHPWRTLRSLALIPGMVVQGTGEILCALVVSVVRRRPLPSHLTAVPFAVGPTTGEAGVETRWRTALAISGTSAAPNFAVLAVLPQQGLLLYHQITPGPVPAFTLRMGASP